MHVLVICDRRFNPHQFWIALGVLRQRGHSFEVISTDHVIRDEVSLKPMRIKRTVDDDIDTSEFDALMVISGNFSDSKAYWNDVRALKLVQQIFNASKPIAAICCAVPTVRYAAKGKQVSFYPIIAAHQALEDAGAILSKVSLSISENLVTAENEMQTHHWAEEFCNMLENKPPELNLQDTGYTPKGRERKPIPELERLKELQAKAKQ